MSNDDMTSADDNLSGCFWWSSKQDDMLSDPAHFDERPRLRNFACLDDGREVRYTTMSSTLDHGCEWDDVKLLGHGRYLRSERQEVV